MACRASATCNALEECLSDCKGEPACRSQCTIANHVQPLSPDLTLAGTLDACLASQCAKECGLDCGALSQIAPPDSAPACEKCLHDVYCATTIDCASSADCQTYLLCRENCVTGDCVGACAGSGTSFFTSFWPIATDCQSACDVGENWACVGHVEWPEISIQTQNLTVQFKDVLTGATEDGITVSMCGGTDTTCPEPVSSKQTDAQGYVTLNDPLWTDQSLGLNGFLDIQSPDLYPTLIYWGFPLTEVQGAIAVPIPAFSLEDWSLIWQGGLDPTRGVILAVAVDCFGSPAPGVALTLSSAPDAGAPNVFYLSGSSPTIAISLTDTTTESNGTGAFVNVPPGPVDVIATPAGIGRPSSRVSVSVRAGTLTEVSLAPTPDTLDVGDAQ